jgi:predicted alpha-1,6-mannanase (GH76 family)
MVFRRRVEQRTQENQDSHHEKSFLQGLMRTTSSITLALTSINFARTIDTYNPTIPLSEIIPAQVVVSIKGPQQAQDNSASDKASAPQSLSLPYTETRKAVTSLLTDYNWNTNLWNGVGWWQDANLIVTIVDYLQQPHTPREVRKLATSEISATFHRYKEGDFLDGFYDDEGWWAKAWAKVGQLTHREKYYAMSQYILENMEQGWDSTCGGGIWWDKTETYKNAITNSLFMNVALLDYQHDKNIDDLTWAVKDFLWFMKSGMLNASYLINDGLAYCMNNSGNVWTYNQGEFIEALVLFSETFKSQYFLRIADLVANATDIADTDRRGILVEKACEIVHCTQGAYTFEGIYIAGLEDLYQRTGNAAYGAFITRNARSIWRSDRGPNYTLGWDWNGPYTDVNPAAQDSAVQGLLAHQELEEVRR